MGTVQVTSVCHVIQMRANREGEGICGTGQKTKGHIVIVPVCCFILPGWGIKTFFERDCCVWFGSRFGVGGRFMGGKGL